jgi:cytochrome b6-f complex iron-sulfur subunit
MSVHEAVNEAIRTRREFCTAACQILTVATAGGLTAALLTDCGGSSPTSPGGGSNAALPVVAGSLANGVVTVSIDASSPLASSGGMALVQASGTVLLVARTGTDAFTAFSATCTHQACTITDFSNQLFVCPCHGSEFDTSGHVVRGPAVVALHAHSAQFANGTLTISG